MVAWIVANDHARVRFSLAALMNTIEEACDKLRSHLQDWYTHITNRAIESNPRTIDAYGLRDAKVAFTLTNPEYNKYDRDIIFGFLVDGDSFRPGCADGCCRPMGRCRGIYVMPVDWKRTNELARRESKTLNLIGQLSGRVHESRNSH